jgi:hypothetical protein
VGRPLGDRAGTGAAVATWSPADAQDAAPADVPAFFRTATTQRDPQDVVATFPRISGAWSGGAEPLLWHRCRGGRGPRPGSTAGRRRGRPPRPARRRVTAVVVVDRVGADSAAVAAWTQRVTGVPGLRTGAGWLFRLP